MVNIALIYLVEIQIENINFVPLFQFSAFLVIQECIKVHYEKEFLFHIQELKLN